MTQGMDTDEVLYEKREDGVAVITMNRPERLNSMGGQLIPLLGRYVHDAAWDDDVRCVVLTGAGRGFCAGADLRLAPGEEAAHKPTVSAINGAAAGAGLGLALACDIKIMAGGAKLTSAYRNVGLSGDFGAAYFLQKSIGYTRAIDLFFSAEIVTAQRALEIGLINRVVPDERLREKSLAYAAWLAAGPAFAFARMKENFVAGTHADARTALQIESLNHNLSGRFRGSEQLSGFAEGRRPAPFNWD
ncbi:MAG: enoyl-CoA hydratase-related protein [Dehalococcoidia bacterium]